MRTRSYRIVKVHDGSRRIGIVLDDGRMVELDRDRAADLAILAGLAADDRAEGRERMTTLELVGRTVVGDAGELNVPAVGPSAIAWACRAFFGRDYRWSWGRRPTAFAVRDGEPCERCGAPAEEAHHRQPRAEGGDDEPENREALCCACHRREPRPRMSPGVRTVEVDQIEESTGSAWGRILAGPGRGMILPMRWPGAMLGVWRVWTRPGGEVGYFEPATVVAERRAT